MMSVKFVFGDLLRVKDVDAIVHQVNCLCVKPHGLSRQIAEKYPWGDIYSKRKSEGSRNLAVVEDRGIPGSIEIFKSPDTLHPHVICFLSQWDFGTSDQVYRQIPPYKDTRENRIKWFWQCLHKLKTSEIKTVGLPYQIGCGLGGGDWATYFGIIKAFAEESGIDFVIVRPHFAHV